MNQDAFVNTLEREMRKRVLSRIMIDIHDPDRADVNVVIKLYSATIRSSSPRVLVDYVEATYLATGLSSDDGTLVCNTWNNEAYCQDMLPQIHTRWLEIPEWLSRRPHITCVKMKTARGIVNHPQAYLHGHFKAMMGLVKERIEGADYHVLRKVHERLKSYLVEQEKLWHPPLLQAMLYQMMSQSRS